MASPIIRASQSRFRRHLVNRKFEAFRDTDPMPKHIPRHQILEQSVQADDINDVISPETIVWAKLRGYPWWPGRVYSDEEYFLG